MEILIVHPDSKEKLTTLKAIMKALKISYREEKSIYNTEFVVKVLQGDEDIKAGRTKKISLDDICKFIKRAL